MKNKNLYEILGLNPDSTKEEIKIAYRKLVRIYHPDINQTKEAENYFKLLNNAVETLLDDTKRLQYDTMAGIFANKDGYVQNEESQKEEVLQNVEKSFDDILAKTQAGKEFYVDKTSKTPQNKGFSQNKAWKTPLGSRFYDYKNPKKQSESPKIDGKDIETVVTISKTEQKQGTVRKINVLHTDKCPKCTGAKYINGTVCALCHGAGEKSEHKIMNVKIPAGIKDKTKMKIKNEGEYGKFGGKNGDLYLLIKIEDEIIKKFGDNNIIEALISPWQAVLGGKITVCVDNKKVPLTIPPLTKSMTRFKLKKEDENLSSLGLKADFTVVIKIDIKENLDEKEIELYKKLRDIDLNKNS